MPYTRQRTICIRLLASSLTVRCQLFLQIFKVNLYKALFFIVFIYGLIYALLLVLSLVAILRVIRFASLINNQFYRLLVYLNFYLFLEIISTEMVKLS